ASMKFAILLLVILAVISVFGLFVEEFLPDNPMASQWSEYVWEKLGSEGMMALRNIGLTRPFQAPWYRFLVALLAVSLLACVIQRLPGILRRLKQGPAKLDKTAILALPLHATISNTTRVALQAKWPKKFTRREEVGETGELWRGEFGHYAHLGPALAHIGMFLLAIGAMMTSLGVNHFQMGGFPGDTIVTEELPFELKIDSFRVEYYPLAPGQTVLVDDEFLGRTVKRIRDNVWLVQTKHHGDKSDRIEIEQSRLKNQFDRNYDGGNIRDYISSVSVIENGQAVRIAHIEVNYPLREKGWRVYQSDYDPQHPRVVARFDTAYIKVSRAADSTALDTLLLTFDNPVTFADNFTLTAGGFYPDYRRGQGEDYSLSAMLNNPAIRIHVSQNDKELSSTVLFQKFAFHGSTGEQVPFIFEILDIKGATSSEELRTIFSFRRDWGGSVIWAGFIVMTIGLLLAFYLIHRRFWIWLEPEEGGKVRAIIGGDSERGKHHFEREFQTIISRMKS
ncbi:cytochrome c biogenesis protein ResB, partial [bacterium]|nr:cytochrome c biogenesis protein ResB [bacterium]